MQSCDKYHYSLWPTDGLTLHFICVEGVRKTKDQCKKKLSQLKLIQVDVSMYINKLMNTTKIIVMLQPQMPLLETAECMPE